MSALSRILRDTTDNGLMFWCPGCNEAHRIQHGAGGGPRWGWNGDIEKPTFTPSILVQGVKRMTDTEHASYMRGEGLPPAIPFTCHSFVADGNIQFLGDCSHALAGQTVPLPDFPRGQE